MALFKETFANVVKAPLEATGKAIGATAGVVEEAASQTKEATPGFFKGVRRITRITGTAATNTLVGLTVMSTDFKEGQLFELKRNREERGLSSDEYRELEKDVLKDID